MTDITDVNLGTPPNATDGDTVRSGFDKVNKNIQALNAGKLETTGGDVSGDLAVGGDFSLDKPAGNYRSLLWKSAGVRRWTFEVDSAAEEGSNAGSNLALSSNTDNGNFLQTFLTFNRGTGVTTIGSGQQVNISGPLASPNDASFGGVVNAVGGMTVGSGANQPTLSLNGNGGTAHLTYKNAGGTTWDWLTYGSIPTGDDGTGADLYLTRYVGSASQDNVVRIGRKDGQVTFKNRPHWGDTSPDQTGPWVTPWDSGNLVSPWTAANFLDTVSHCYLSYTSANALTLSPKGGRTIPIGVAGLGARSHKIPSAGVTLAPAGTAATTLYYIYAVGDGTNVTSMEASTTGYAIDADSGIAVKNGDGTRALVGMAYVVTAGQWQDSASSLGVLSYHNRRNRIISGTNNNGQANVSTAWVTLNFLAWGDEGVSLDASGFGSVGTANSTATAALRIDSAAVGSAASNSFQNAGYNAPYSPNYKGYPTEGKHVADIYGAMNNNAVFAMTTTLCVSTRG